LGNRARAYEEKRQETLERCETPQVKMNVFRAHSYAAEPEHLGEGVELAAIDGRTPLAFSDGFMALGTQFHPEARYASVSAYGDKYSQDRQKRMMDSFVEICKMHHS
ncbi:MAG TPA: hypothetical protein PLV25_05130, partial [Opitutales bacterium]|nr:hypothetical protein [Opitutales bacterium]